jgi:D-aspartate ligase
MLGFSSQSFMRSLMGNGVHRRRTLACVIGDISMVRALGIRGLPVAVVTQAPQAKCTLSRFCVSVVNTPSWNLEPDAAVDALIAWGKGQASRPVLFYQGDYDLLAVSRARERLARHFRFVLPDKELVEDLVDKLRFASLARTAALPVPYTCVLPQGTNAANVLRRWRRFPCVFKPSIRNQRYELMSSHRKALRIESRADLAQALRWAETEGGGFVVQDCVEGGEENVLSYHAYVRPGGEIVAEFTGRKIRTSPRTYGRSTYLEITHDPEMLALGRTTIEKLQFSGVLKIDCKRDVRNRQLYMLEINPRFNLWHHPGTVAGVAIPEAVYLDCVTTNAVKRLPPARKGVRWMVPLSDAKALSEYRAAGELSRARWLIQLLTADVNEGFQITDPLPLLADVGRLIKRMNGRKARQDGKTA